MTSTQKSTLTYPVRNVSCHPRLLWLNEESLRTQYDSLRKGKLLRHMFLRCYERSVESEAAALTRKRT